MKVHVVAGNRGKFVLRWTDDTGKQNQRTVDVLAKPANRSKAYKLAADLESELRGDSPANIMLKQRNDAETVLPGTSVSANPDWIEFKAYFQESHLDALSSDYSSTMNGVLSKFESFANPQIVRDVTPSKIRMWFAQLRKEGLADSTIQTYWRHLHAFLSIAADDYVIDQIPRVRTPKSKPKMKGRPLTGEEYERIKSKAKEIRGKQWEKSVECLWLSGLRISEAYRLTWHRSEFCIDLDGQYPCYHIEGAQKNREHQRLPIVPEFAKYLENRRRPRGNVLQLPMLKVDRRVSLNQAKKIIAKFGSDANVVTAPGKTATAHDFRRSFGLRHALKMMPQFLQQLMRHASISTTMTFYAHLSAESVIDALSSHDQPHDQGHQDRSIAKDQKRDRHAKNSSTG